VAGGLVTAVLVLRSLPSAAGLALASLVVALAVALALAEIGGRPMDEWLPTVGRYLARRVARRHVTVPGTGSRPRHAGGRAGLLPVPRPLAKVGFEQLGGGPGGRPVAVVVDRPTGTLAAVLAVRGRSFPLLDANDQERRLEAWGRVLAGLAREGGPVRRVQWVERSVGGDGAALQRHLSARLALDPWSAPARSYADLVAEAGPLTQAHECHVVLAVRSGATRAGLARELRLLEGQLVNADIEVDGPLDLRRLAAVVRTAYAPAARAELSRRGATHADLAGSHMRAAWPAATETTWAALRTDDTWHATFWVAEWPRAEVSPDFLAPLLLNGTGQRVASLVMAPLPPSDGFREAESARTAAVADEELRRRAGFLGTARRRRQAQGMAQREAELSDGHAAYRFSGYVAVSAADRSQLEDACAEIEQLGHQCRLDLRRLHGIQDVAFTWTLPLARGLS
jgi:hypothetical protein